MLWKTGRVLISRLSKIGDFAVILILLAFFAGAIYGSGYSHSQAGDVNWWAWMDGFWQNFGTEMFGAFLTFLLIETLLGTRHKRDDLIRQMRSSVNDIAVSAAEELRAQRWLEDGTLIKARLDCANLKGAELKNANLQGAELEDANLEGANLGDANLEGANLEGARLKEAILVGTNLEGANLEGANLRGARVGVAMPSWLVKPGWKPTNLERARLMRTNLEGACLHGVNLERAYMFEANLAGANLEEANLQEAYLSDADMEEANLEGANLAGANLQWANLAGANLRSANLIGVDLMQANLTGADLLEANLEGATLPNEIKWTPDTDISCFTTIEHPDFWFTDLRRSPAHLDRVFARAKSLAHQDAEATPAPPRHRHCTRLALRRRQRQLRVPRIVRLTHKKPKSEI